jgi:dTDP-4-amino-4,6-dideoxygalactose transaminase
MYVDHLHAVLEPGVLAIVAVHLIGQGVTLDLYMDLDI